MKMSAEAIGETDSRFPARLRTQAGSTAPAQIFALGNVALLGMPSLALFCSEKCPGRVILPAYDTVAKCRDAQTCIVSGFHSSVEKECLRILMRGLSPVIICPARSLDGFRLPTDWKPAFEAGRVLITSPFFPGNSRITAELAGRRNEFVAALANEILVLYARPGGRLARLIDRLQQEGRRVRLLQDRPCHASQLLPHSGSTAKLKSSRVSHE